MADDLTQALTGLNYTPADTGYGIAQMGLSNLTPQLITPYSSTGRAVGIGLGSILLQSLLGYQARQQAAQDTLELNSLANQLMTKETPQARTEFIGGVSDPGYQSRLSTLSTALMQQEAARKANVAEKLLGLETAAQFELGPTGTKLAEAMAQREANKKAAELAAYGQAIETPEGQQGLLALAEMSRAKGAGVSERQMYGEEQKNERQQKGFRNLSGKQYEDAQDAARLAAGLTDLQKQIKDLSYGEIKTMITTGISPKGKPGLAARFEQYQQLYRNPNFGTALTGNELASSETVFGKNLAATKDDMLNALKFLSESQFDKAELIIKSKQRGPEDLLGAIQRGRTTGKIEFAEPDSIPLPTTPSPQQQSKIQEDIAKLEQVLSQPVSDATKAAARAKIQELLGQ